LPAKITWAAPPAIILAFKLIVVAVKVKLFEDDQDKLLFKVIDEPTIEISTVPLARAELIVVASVELIVEKL
jgi:hypothetical protein